MFLKSSVNSVKKTNINTKKIMIVKIPGGIVKKVLPKGRIVPVIEERPNLHSIDLTLVKLVKVLPKKSLITWDELVVFMKMQQNKGFLTFGPREWLAIFYNQKVREWMQNQPVNNPWKVGYGGLIGFPNGLIKVPGRSLNYDAAIWIPKLQGWHVRMFSADNGEKFPNWYSYLRLAVYPINKERD